MAHAIPKLTPDAARAVRKELIWLGEVLATVLEIRQVQPQPAPHPAARQQAIHWLRAVIQHACNEAEAAGIAASETGQRFHLQLIRGGKS